MDINKDAVGTKPAMEAPQEKPRRENEVRKAEGPGGEGAPTRSSTRALVFFVLVLLVIIAIVLALVLTQKDDNGEGVAEIPMEVDFTSGVSLVTYYGINATISQRLARTVLTIKVANALNCVSIHGVTLQLPLAARVTSLRSMTGECSTYGEVQTLEEARDTFAENAEQGLPGAYVEARDSVTYSLQVSMEPYGETTVELILEELLRQRVGEVEFQIPLVPNEQVDQVTLFVKVLDVGEALDPEFTGMNEQVPSNASEPAIKATSGPSFRLDLGPSLSATNQSLTSAFFLDIPDAREHDLPQLLRGFYNPKKLPPNGALHTDGRCFEMFFLPTDLQSKPRNIVLLLDGLDYYYQPNLFNEVKQAAKNLVDSLKTEDTLTIQVFGNKGTEYLWGTAPATPEEKKQARQFLDGLEPLSHGASNLHEAFLEGLLRAKRDADDEGGAVTLLVLLSNNRATAGQTNRSKIASDVWNLNSEGQVKIFSFGFERSDIELLRAIAIMNGGVASSVVPGTDDYQSQLEHFFDSEFGNVLLSDVHVKLSSSDTLVYGETRQFFPVLSQGSEIVVRGLLNTTSSPGILEAVTTAMASDGEASWTATAEPEPFSPTADLPNSLCFQSYAHSRITQLLHFRDAAELLGDGVIKPVVKLTKHCSDTTTLVDCIEQEALSLALEANVVTRGLTGLVTIDEDKCLSFEGETEICVDGTSEQGYWQSTNAPESLSRPVSGESMGEAPAAAYYGGREEDGGYDASSGFLLFSTKAMLLGMLVLDLYLL